MLSRLSVRLALPALLVAPVAVVSAVLGYISVAQSRQSTDELAARVAEESAARIEQRVAAEVAALDRASRMGAAMLRFGLYVPGDLRSWDQPLREHLLAFPELAGVAWGEPNGHAVWLAKYPGDLYPEFAIKDEQTEGDIVQRDMFASGVVSDTIKGRVAFDLFSRPWYRAGADAPPGQPAWSEIYSWVRADGSDETLGISYARAIRDDANELVGVLDAEIELVKFSRFLSTLGLGDSGHAAIVEADGKLVAASRGQALLDDDANRRFAWDASHETTRALGAAARAAIEQGDLTLPTRSKVAGQWWWVTTHRLPESLGLDWVMVIGLPESDLIAGVREAQARALRAGALAAAITLIFGIALASLAVRPIVRLRDAVARIGAGDLDTESPAGGPKELAQLAHDLDQMRADLKDRMRLRRSVELAMDVQQAFLPSDSPKIPGLDIAGHSTYCDETGGDYYDFLGIDNVSSHAVGVALGDVMGHGVPAALLMASARAVLRSRAAEAGSLAQLLGFINKRLEEDTGGERFMTLLLLAIEPPTEDAPATVRYASAGHGPPYVFRADKRQWDELPTGGLPLGIFDGEVYQERDVGALEPGDIVLATTDGLWEPQNEQGEAFSIERVKQLVERNADLPAIELAERLHDELMAYCAPRRPDDDVTFVIVKAVR